MSLYDPQAAAAVHPASVAVTAGAGTGKTFLLTQRFLYHLAQGQSPLQIVAVTFTNKAADELRSRIRAQVAESFPDRPDIAAELEGSQISTIHSLAARICREHPAASGAPQGFTILDDVEGTLWNAEQVSAALDALPAGMYAQIPFSLTRAIITSLLRDPLVAERALDCDPDIWPALVNSERTRARRSLVDDPAWQASRATIQEIIGDDRDRLEVIRRAAADAIDSLGHGDNITESLETLADIKVNVGSKKNWPADSLDEVKTALKNVRDAAKKALTEGLIILELGAVDEFLREKLPVIGEAFAQVRAFITDAKRRARALDYADLEVCAVRALQDTSVQAYYAERWRAFLVDEFQDTNPIQADLLKHLIAPSATLTIVGDEKQSIFGFRRADVTVFRQFSRHIVEHGGHSFVLDKTYRTHAPLVQTLNGVFPSLLGNLHQPLTSARADVPHDGPHLHAYVIDLQEAEKPLKAQRQWVEANKIAHLLGGMIDSELSVHDKQTRTHRPVRHGDIAILGRTTASLDVYATALESAGIPAVVVGGGNLLDTREVKDAYALLRFLADARDNLALAAILRSPFFAVSDPTLFTFAQQLPKEISWWEAMAQSDVPELAAAREVLENLRVTCRVDPPSRVLQLACRLTGYTAVIANLPNAARREANWRGFSDLVRSLEQGNGDVFVVVRRLRRLLQAGVTVEAPPLQAGDAVALLTIHASKGLEWPVVVLPDLSHQSPSADPLLYFDPEVGIGLRITDEDDEKIASATYRILHARAKLREEDEERRILYVALTRARDHLILTACDAKKANVDRLTPGLESVGIAWDTIPFDRQQSVPPAPGAPVAPATPAEMLVGSIGSGLVEIPATALSEYALCPKRFRYRFVDGHPGLGEGPAIARRVGRLTHLALEQDITDAKALATHDRDLPMDHIGEALYLARCFHEGHVYAALRDATTAREQAVAMEIRNLTIHGMVDLFGPDFVLDFKTDQEMRPDQHRFQLWIYARALGRSAAHIAYLRHNEVHTYDRPTLERTADKAQSLVDGIVRGRYAAKPSPESCPRCPFAEICDERLGP